MKSSIWKAGTFWVSRRIVPWSSFGGEVLVGFKREFSGLGKKLLTQNPVRVEDVILVEVKGIVIFDDASDQHVREREGFRQVLQAFGLDDGFFKNLAVKVGDGAVGTDRPRLDAADFPLALEEGDLDVGILPPLFSENLDAFVVVLVTIAAVVAVHLAVKINRRRTRSFGDAGHLQLFRRDRQPFVAGAGRVYKAHDSRQYKDSQKNAAKVHVSPPKAEITSGQNSTPSPQNRESEQQEEAWEKSATIGVGGHGPLPRKSCPVTMASHDIPVLPICGA